MLCRLDVESATPGPAIDYNRRDTLINPALVALGSEALYARLVESTPVRRRGTKREKNRAGCKPSPPSADRVGNRWFIDATFTFSAALGGF